MFSCRLMKVNGVLLPEIVRALGEEGQVVRWKVHLTHGSQEHTTQFTATASGAKKLLEPQRTDLVTATGPPWKQEVEFEDNEGEEKVEVSLLFDVAPKFGAPPGHKLLRHSMASIDLKGFRSQPEERVELWLPLQPLNSGDHRDYGAIQMSVMYSDDYVAQGYMFALFCGLTLPRLSGGPFWRTLRENKNDGLMLG